MTTYATYADPADAERAAGALLDHGVKSEHISIVFPESYRSRIYDLDGNVVEDPKHEAETGITTTTAEDVGAGAVKGTAAGLVAGAIAGLAAVTIPGFGLVLGGGALALAAAGAAGTTAAGALAGGVAGYLIDQGVPSHQSSEYERHVRSGGALLTVYPVDEQLEGVEIDSILAKYGGTVSHYKPAEQERPRFIA